MEKDRIIRVSDNLKKEIAFEIQHSDLKETCGFFSINHVETTRDLSSAKVFFSTVNSPIKQSELVEFLNKNAWKLRKSLAQKLHLKKMPSLYFIYDEHSENVRNIDTLIDNLD